jgi:hypothetical protein
MTVPLSGMLACRPGEACQSVPEPDENEKQVDLAMDFVRNTSNTGESHD